jgi:dTDP-4-amino-4,6-dideoxygalactose transaminase
MSENREPRVYFGRPILGTAERAAASGILCTPQLSQGGAVAAFEEGFEQFTTGGMSLAVSSCTAGLHLSAMELFKPGDKVIVPAMTHVATAHAIEAVGAEPVFADVSLRTGSLDFRTIEELTDKTIKGIVVVHYLGACRDIEMIAALARKKDIPLIEDCALALGTRVGDTHVGLFGTAGSFSFYPVKHITTGGEGGMVVTRDTGFNNAISRRRHFGQKERMGDVHMLGLNYRMTEMQAAIGLVQLNRYTEFAKTRARNHDILRHALSRGRLAELPVVESPYPSNYAITILVPNKRDKIRHVLKSRNVETSIYYPTAVPLLKYYKAKYGYKTGDFPNAEQIAKKSICLPVGPHLQDKHMKYLAKALNEVIKEECELPSSAVLAGSATT